MAVCCLVFLGDVFLGVGGSACVFHSIAKSVATLFFFSLFRDSVLQHGLCVLLAMIAFVAVEAFVAATLCLC